MQQEMIRKPKESCHQMILDGAKLKMSGGSQSGAVPEERRQG